MKPEQAEYNTPTTVLGRKVVLIRTEDLDCPSCLFGGDRRVEDCSENNLVRACGGGHFIAEDEYLKRRLRGEI